MQLMDFNVSIREILSSHSIAAVVIVSRVSRSRSKP